MRGWYHGCFESRSEVNVTDNTGKFEASGDLKAELIEEIAVLLRNRTDEELANFVNRVMRFVHAYAFGYQLEGPIYLVLDNSLIQDFKHREDPNRALNAHAHTVFCRFVTGWSDRPTQLALSPVAVYEHIGRRVATTAEIALAAVADVRRLLASSRLEMGFLRFRSARELVAKMRDVDTDAQVLAEVATSIKEGDWKIDLSSDMGVKIPISIAREMIRDDLPLKYFSPAYVKETFASRIEALIIHHSNGNPKARPISSGEYSRDLADLTTLARGVLKGLGDIDLFQICDGARQYQQRSKAVFLGQAVDETLNRVLVRRQFFIEGRGVQLGTPGAEKRLDDMVRFMFSNPYAEQDARLARINPRIVDFLEVLGTACEVVRNARK